jgi:capsule biosynthesis phosphatase
MNRVENLIFDIDGTLCPIKGKDENYEDLIPYENVVRKIREYHEQGVKITFFTSRNMNSFNGQLGLINKVTAKILLEWLDKWNIPYDEIIYGKPWPGHFGFYIDDRAVRPDEFLKYSADDLNLICKNSRIK